MDSKRPFQRFALVALVASILAFAPVGPLAQQTASWPEPIDVQAVRDQDDMTWDDYKPVPGTNWADPTKVGSVRTIRLAIVCADFADFPFVITMPKKSDLYGNPQVDPIKREEVAKYYEDFYARPQDVNRGHTIHEYWMEQSRGRLGVSVKAFGPYKLPLKSYQYGFSGGDANMPTGETSSPNAARDLEAMWLADAGPEIKGQFDLVVRFYAGYDESSVWQEFGEMKFQTRDDIPAEWGNPDPTKPRWARTRYVEWTSWNAASWLWSNAGGGAITTSESSGAMRHEVSHAALRIGDNYNNPYVRPYRRVGSGPWDLMDRGSFNGPGGPHRRYVVPKTEGDVMSAGMMLRQRVAFNFVAPEQVLTVTRAGLVQSGLIVANVTARAAEPVAPSLSGVVVRLEGEPPDKTPVEDPAQNPLWSGNPTYNFFSLEVVQRIGYDSYTPDSGVLIAKNKDQAGAVGGPNSFSVFNWVIDAHPEDINKVDFKRPDGTPVMRTIADYRQLNDALFHAGLNSGSQYEWKDEPNQLHFYVIDRQIAPNGVMSYALGVRSTAGSGPQARGIDVKAPAGATTISAGGRGMAAFTITNTGQAAAPTGTLHPSDATTAASFDIYRASVAIEGDGWTAALQNALAGVKAGASQPVQVFISRAAKSSASATIALTVTSESDPTKTQTIKYTVR